MSSIKGKRLLDQVRDYMRLKHYSNRGDRYALWSKQRK